MKKIISLVAAALLLNGVAIAQNTSPDESAAITKTALDYIEGWYASDAARMERAHATFMNRLAADGFVVLGGPLGDLNDVFLLIIHAADANEINATLDRDPWTQSGMLEIKNIQPWTILLEANKEA